jgi:hypothetical protein
MHYARKLRTFFYSHYFHLGLRFAAGLIGVTVIALQFAGVAVAMTVCIGALCTALMDMPSPLNHNPGVRLAHLRFLHWGQACGVAFPIRNSPSRLMPLPTRRRLLTRASINQD